MDDLDKLAAEEAPDRGKVRAQVAASGFRMSVAGAWNRPLYGKAPEVALNVTQLVAFADMQSVAQGRLQASTTPAPAPLPHVAAPDGAERLEPDQDDQAT